MNVLLTFDTEIWCGGWRELDRVFPQKFDRYVYGRSAQGEFALPATLDILKRNGLTGVFFVEPLFAARFGIRYLREVVQLIQDAGQIVELHLHPEWVDEIDPPLVARHGKKRGQMHEYSLADQQVLVKRGAELLAEAGARPLNAFRAGNFGANVDTLRALATIGIRYDSSMNATFANSFPADRNHIDMLHASVVETIASYPLSIIRSAGGALRHAQVGACSASELIEAIESAAASGWPYFNILSHNFEMLKAGGSEADRFVVRRFETLCAFLGANKDRFPTGGFSALPANPVPAKLAPPRSSLWSVGVRVGEQALRRLAAY